MRNSKNGFRTIKHKLKAALSGGLFWFYHRLACVKLSSGEYQWKNSAEKSLLHFWIYIKTEKEKPKQNKCTPGVWNSDGTLRFNHLWNSHADKEKIIMHVQCSIGCIYGMHNRPWKTVSTYICILSHFCNSFLLCIGCGEFIKIRKIKSGRSNLLVTWNFLSSCGRGSWKNNWSSSSSIFPKKDEEIIKKLKHQRGWGNEYYDRPPYRC